jgi:hypothetical protein
MAFGGHVRRPCEQGTVGPNHCQWGTPCVSYLRIGKPMSILLCIYDFPVVLT